MAGSRKACEKRINLKDPGNDRRAAGSRFGALCRHWVQNAPGKGVELSAP